MPELFVDNNFQQIIRESELPVCVMFSASWCQPCKQMEPIFKKLAQEFTGNVIFASSDIEKNQQIASHYGIYSVPSFGLFVNGMVREIYTGTMSKTDLRLWIKENI